MLTDKEISEIKDLCKKNRINILKMVHSAKSGHIGGAFSSVEIMTVLFHKCMKLAPKCENDCPRNFRDKAEGVSESFEWPTRQRSRGVDPRERGEQAAEICFSLNYETRDRFVLSKGHASAVFYSVLSQVGYIDESELMTFRKFKSRLQGHPTKLCAGVEVPTGSLGQGLSIACGISSALKLNNNPAKVFVLLGDGELQEGSVWEGFMHGAGIKADNLIAIIDRNRLQIDGCTENIKPLDNLKSKLDAFNWFTIEIDGHNINEVYDAIETAKTKNMPVAIIANTVKGKGVSFMENNAGWHGKAPSDEEFNLAMAELIKE